MRYRPLALAAAVATLVSMHVASATAQSAYVAPGGIYIGAGAGPVHVTPGDAAFRAAAYAEPGYDCGYGGAAYVDRYAYGVGAYEEPGYGCGCEPGPYVTPRYGYGYGPAPVPNYGYGYGPVPPPRYGYGPAPVPRYGGYGSLPAPRDGYGYGPEPVPDHDYGYEPVPRRHGYGPAPRDRYGYGPVPRAAYGPAPRYKRPAPGITHARNGDAAEPPGQPHAPAPFAGQR